jgi:hypothetical protein
MTHGQFPTLLLPEVLHPSPRNLRKIWCASQALARCLDIYGFDHEGSGIPRDFGSVDCLQIWGSIRLEDVDNQYSQRSEQIQASRDE